MAHRKLMDSPFADFIPEAGGLGHSNRALGCDLYFRLDNVFFPITLAGRNVAGPNETRMRRHGDVVGSPDSGFDHSLRTRPRTPAAAQ